MVWSWIMICHNRGSLWKKEEKDGKKIHIYIYIYIQFANHSNSNTKQRWTHQHRHKFEMLLLKYTWREKPAALLAAWQANTAKLAKLHLLHDLQWWIANYSWSIRESTVELFHCRCLLLLLLLAACCLRVFLCACTLLEGAYIKLKPLIGKRRNDEPRCKHQNR